MALKSLNRRAGHWLDKMRLSETARRIREERLTYLPVRKSVRIEASLAEVNRRNVSGDIVEFGVALGGSAILLARETSEARRFFGLDVFATSPSLTSEKEDRKSCEEGNTFARRIELHGRSIIKPKKQHQI